MVNQKDRLIVLIVFIIMFTSSFYLMFVYFNYVLESKIPYKNLGDQLSSGLKLTIQGIIFHYLFFLIISIIGGYYIKKKHPKMLEFKKGFLYTTYLMCFLGLLYLAVYLLEL